MYPAHILLRTFVVALLSLPVSAWASSWSCSHDNDVREVHVVRTTLAPVPCHVLYKKLTEGVEDQILWNAESQEGFCEDKAKEFVVKLESWGWVCAETISEETEPASEDSTMESDDSGDNENEGAGDPEGGSDEGAES